MGSGNSKTETQYNYVDHSAQREEDARTRELNRLANERRARELVAQQRIDRNVKFVAELERRAFLLAHAIADRVEEDVEETIQLIKKYGKEKLAELKKQSEAKRKALFDYQFGCKIHLASFRGLDISDIKHKKLRIGVFGPTGSGKSCFINTCERVVLKKEKGSCPIATSGGEGTIVLEDFLNEMSTFTLVDTRGFFHYDNDENVELRNILYGRVKKGDPIKRKEDEPTYNVSKTDAPFSDWIHGIILVVKANDPRLKQGALRDYLNPVRQILRPKGISPVTVVTHRDTLETQKECDDALELASAATGSSRSHTFFVANYCPDNPGPDVETELQIFDILHFALLTAERYVKIAKQQKRNREEDQMVAAMENATIGSPSTINKNASIEMFLNLLQCKYKWKETDIKRVLSKLEEEDITTIGLLKENWSDAREMFTLGMRNSVEKQLKNIDVI